MDVYLGAVGPLWLVRAAEIHIYVRVSIRVTTVGSTTDWKLWQHYFLEILTSPVLLKHKLLSLLIFGIYIAGVPLDALQRVTALKSKLRDAERMLRVILIRILIILIDAINRSQRGP